MLPLLQHVTITTKKTKRGRRRIVLLFGIILLVSYTFFSQPIHQQLKVAREYAVSQGCTSLDTVVNICNGMAATTTTTTKSIASLHHHHHGFHLKSHAIISSLVNKTTIIQWNDNFPKENVFGIFLNLFDPVDVIGDTDRKKEMALSKKVWSDPSRRFVHQHLCPASRSFAEEGGVKRHVLLTHLNENWGAFSSEVPNRTIHWGNFDRGLGKQGCDRASILAYLDHPNTLGVFTTTFQDLNHPKAHSIPLGVKSRESANYYDMQLKKGPSYRTNLLMINAADDRDSRVRQIDFVMSALRKNSGLNLSNTYKQSKYDEYFDELRCSKFILCPSGLGWDTYRMWEAFVMGAIPIVERYNRTDGWHRTMEGLPMLWVDTFEDKDLWTVDFLEAEYDRIVSVDAAEYRYEKLTIPYWKNFIESLLVLGKDGDEEEVTRMTKANNTGEDLDIEVLHTDTDSSAGLKQQQQAISHSYSSST